MKGTAERSVFSRLLNVHTVPDGGLETSIEATAAECVVIAEAIGVVSLGGLDATFGIGKRSGGRFKIDGTVKARITQVCVVTLEPFESDIDAPIDMTLALVERPESPSGAERISKRRSRRAEPQETVAVPIEPSEDDPPDPIVDGYIDLGAAALEFLTLALDFYPRKLGAQFSNVAIGDMQQSPSAFAALERLKDRS